MSEQKPRYKNRHKKATQNKVAFSPRLAPNAYKVISIAACEKNGNIVIKAKDLFQPRHHYNQYVKSKEFLEKAKRTKCKADKPPFSKDNEERNSESDSAVDFDYQDASTTQNQLKLPEDHQDAMLQKDEEEVKEKNHHAEYTEEVIDESSHKEVVIQFQSNTSDDGENINDDNMMATSGHKIRDPSQEEEPIDIDDSEMIDNYPITDLDYPIRRRQHVSKIRRAYIQMENGELSGPFNYEILTSNNKMSPNQVIFNPSKNPSQLATISIPNKSDNGIRNSLRHSAANFHSHSQYEKPLIESNWRLPVQSRFPAEEIEEESRLPPVRHHYPEPTGFYQDSDTENSLRRSRLQKRNAEFISPRSRSFEPVMTDRSKPDKKTKKTGKTVKTMEEIACELRDEVRFLHSQNDHLRKHLSKLSDSNMTGENATGLDKEISSRNKREEARKGNTQGATSSSKLTHQDGSMNSSNIWLTDSMQNPLSSLHNEDTRDNYLGAIRKEMTNSAAGREQFPSDGGLYDMLRQYMVENEKLREMNLELNKHLTDMQDESGTLSSTHAILTARLSQLQYLIKNEERKIKEMQLKEHVAKPAEHYKMRVSDMHKAISTKPNPSRPSPSYSSLHDKGGLSARGLHNLNHWLLHEIQFLDDVILKQVHKNHHNV